jgi:hypothetical protein
MSTTAFECDLLWSLALCMDFPHASAEHDFRDYFDHSVTLYLSIRRPSPSSSKCLSLYVGAQFVISCSLQAGSNESLQRK